MSKDFGMIGPFNLEESIALSTSDPHECVPWEWGNRTHLESAGSTCLSHGKRKYYGCRSSHPNRLSTVIYYKIKTVLCQIDDSKGMFVFDRSEAERFISGFNHLLEDKIDPKSALSKELEKLRIELRTEIRAEIGKNPFIPKSILSKIKTIYESGILEPPNLKILERIKKQKYPTCWISKEDLERFIKLFYGGRLGGVIHTGMALYHLRLPTDHLVKSAQNEQLAIVRLYRGDSDLEKTILKHMNTSKALFA
ncbi:MAG: hypothetical protein WA063_05640 [Minisyncoccia bacterium]